MSGLDTVDTSWEDDGEHVHLRFSRDDVDTLYAALVALNAHKTLGRDLYDPSTGMVLYMNYSSMRKIVDLLRPCLRMNKAPTGGEADKLSADDYKKRHLATSMPISLDED